MQTLVQTLQGAIDQLGRLGISSLVLFFIFIALYVVTATVVLFSKRAISRIACFLLNQILTAAVVLLALKDALPDTFPWKEALGMAAISACAAFALMHLLHRRSSRAAHPSSSQNGISRRARKLAEASEKAAAMAAAAPAPQPISQIELVAPTASDISRRIELHSRKKTPIIKSAVQSGFGRR